MKSACLVLPLAALMNGLGILADGRPSTPNTKYSVVGDGILGRLAECVLSQRGYRVEQVFLDAKPVATAGLAGDVILATEGTRDSLEVALQNSRRGATVVFFGTRGVDSDMSIKDLAMGDKTIIVSVETGPEKINEAIRLLNVLELDLFSANVFELSQFASAWEEYETNRAFDVVIEIDPRQEIQGANVDALAVDNAKLSGGSLGNDVVQYDLVAMGSASAGNQSR